MVLRTRHSLPGWPLSKLLVCLPQVIWHIHSAYSGRLGTGHSTRTVRGLSAKQNLWTRSCWKQRSLMVFPATRLDPSVSNRRDNVPITCKYTQNESKWHMGLEKWSLVIPFFTIFWQPPPPPRTDPGRAMTRPSSATLSLHSGMTSFGPMEVQWLNTASR